MRLQTVRIAHSIRAFRYLAAAGKYGGSSTGRKSGDSCISGADFLSAGNAQGTFDGVDIVDAAAPGSTAELLQKCP